MPLKKSKGNMYNWVSHVHSHLAGRCIHQCSYCYVQVAEKRNPSGRYAGPTRLIEKEFKVNYGEGKTIFIEHMNDLLAVDIPNDWIRSIINHTLVYPRNTYVFQTKNPMRYYNFLELLPHDAILGTTIESNRIYPGLSKAPVPRERTLAMIGLPDKFKKFLTIEPVLQFDVEILGRWISDIRPDFLNLGADSKGFGLPEPTVEKIMELTNWLKEEGIELREKHNLQRLLKE